MVVVVAVLTPSTLALAAATHVADVLPEMMQVSLTLAVMPAVTVKVSRSKVEGPSVTVTYWGLAGEWELGIGKVTVEPVMQEKVPDVQAMA